MADDEQTKAAKAEKRRRATAVAEGNWVPSEKSKSKAIWYRVAAAVLWAAAIGIEIWVIVKILLPSGQEVVTWQILAFLAAMAVLAIGGNLLWRKANRIDPASEKQKFRFFVQNQLGAIITVIAFLPLIVLIFLDKDMSGKQKGIIGGIAVVLAGIVFATGVETNPVSSEQMARERNVVQELTGQNVVWWSASGKKFHVCQNVGALRNTKPENLRHGTVEQAHEDGVNELTKQWVSEARSPKQCNIPGADQKIEAILNGAVPGLSADEAKKTVDEEEVKQLPATPNNVTPLPTKAPTTVPTPAKRPA